MPQVRRKAKKDFPTNDKTGVVEIISRYKKKKAATPEKMARLRGHLSSLIALKYGFILRIFFGVNFEGILKDQFYRNFLPERSQNRIFQQKF